MTIDKTKYIKALKAIDQMNIFLMLVLALIHPYLPVYDEAGKMNEYYAFLRILIIVLVLFMGLPIFKKELKQIRENKKPYQIKKKNNVVHIPKVNYFVAVAFAVCPIAFIPMAIYRYAPEGIQAQAFYALLYLFIYVGVGTRLQMKIGLNTSK
ncbi:MAG: hypothetical protein SPI65_00295 [Peptoniphilus sp.]|nr:hypothetical protein [Peptoniphilus sp.]MDD7362806.1 hypothetical protein [Bacillota bacterium]MDY6044002.1 hypothetical protein [Peptoniphilus sp.]